MSGLKKFWRENRGILVFLSMMFVVRSSFADWYHVPTGSMQPNIVEGDRILVNKMAYRIDVPFTDIAIQNRALPQRGEVVVFESEKADNRLIKRVIGIAGDEVAMQNNRLIVNGEVANYASVEGNIYRETIGAQTRNIQIRPNEKAFDSFEPVVVPPDHILVLGDNRNNSADSRYYGFVPVSELSGRAVKVLASFNPDNFYIPRRERFLSEL